MQQSLSRVIQNVYITMSFTDETLHSAEVTIPVKVAWVKGCMIYNYSSANNGYLYITSEVHNYIESGRE